jgi:sec-independent protein translocase protein TatB
VFNFQGSEVIIILLLALVVLGPEKLPEAMRRLGRFYGDLKKMSTGFQEEFRAAVREPTRELRDTANTLRDSLDFRKLQDGSRGEKPKSAEMAPADPDAVPTDDVPFRPDTISGPEPEPANATEPEPTTEPEPDSPILHQTSTPPAPPPPFSGSQAISAKPPSPRVAPQVAIDDEHGLREARPTTETEDGAA